MLTTYIQTYLFLKHVIQKANLCYLLQIKILFDVFVRTILLYWWFTNHMSIEFLIEPLNNGLHISCRVDKHNGLASNRGQAIIWTNVNINEYRPILEKSIIGQRWLSILHQLHRYRYIGIHLHRMYLVVMAWCEVSPKHWAQVTLIWSCNVSPTGSECYELHERKRFPLSDPRGIVSIKGS